MVLNPRETLYIGGDTITPEVRIYLDNAFGQTLLDADSSVYDSNQDWREYFPGLLVAPDLNGPGQGAVGIDVTTGLSRMRLHYHSDTDSAATYDFIINALSPRNNLFEHQWYPPFQALDEAYITTLDGSMQAGVFSGSGLKTRIQLPGLTAWESERDDDRAVHKAELWLPVDPQYNDARYPIPSHLFILSENEDGEAVSTPDQTLHRTRHQWQLRRRRKGLPVQHFPDLSTNAERHVRIGQALRCVITGRHLAARRDPEWAGSPATRRRHHELEAQRAHRGNMERIIIVVKLEMRCAVLLDT